jgi:hypothetical protein
MKSVFAEIDRAIANNADNPYEPDAIIIPKPPYLADLERQYDEIAARINRSSFRPDDLINHHTWLGAEIARCYDIIDGKAVFADGVVQNTARRLMNSVA